MRIAVYCDGAVIVTVPYSFSEISLKRFIRAHTAWTLSKRESFRPFRERVLARSRTEYGAHKERALAFVRSRVEALGRIYGYTYGRVAIKNQKTCWGSCSKRGNLNFNYRILFLPERLQDYIIAHELCHLKELNHSKTFWSLLGAMMPDYAEARRALRRHSA